MNKRTSPPVRSAPRPALAVSTTDAVALVYLLGEAIAPPDELSSKRERVMAGLCQLVGADGWAIWLENESGCHSVFLRSTLESTESAGAEPHLPSCDVAASHFPHPGKVIIGSFGPLLVHRQSADGLALGIFRKSPGTSFSPREERLVRMVLEEVPWLSDLTPASGDLHWPLLPPRQIEILELLRRGMDRKSIADHLAISPKTVAAYQNQIYRKLGVTSQIALMRMVPAESSNPSRTCE